MKAEVFLDARLMEPPEPLLQGVAALMALSPGQFFHMQHRMAPRMLYPELVNMGLAEKSLQLADDEFHLVVWSPSDPAACVAAEQCYLQLQSKL